MQVLGIGQRFVHFATKLFFIREELEKIKNNSNLIVMFTDAYDVIVHQNPKTIISRFKDLNANVVFGAEYFCNPDKKVNIVLGKVYSY